MALYSFSAQYVGASHALKNCVAAAAYRSAERLYDERNQEAHDYTGKRVEFSEILAPSWAPEWVYDRSKLWNECEMSRTRVLGVTARELRIALPRELTREQQVELVRGFLNEEFVALGMVADWSLHDESDKNQPHVHVMLTTRELDPAYGFGNQARAWDKKRMLYRWREQWAEHANRSLERAGHEERIDHRSYKDRGIELEPQPKLYRHPNDVGQDGRDLVSERMEAFRDTARRNGERIIADPTIPLRMLTQQRATFRREDLLKVLHTHSVDAEQFAQCLHAVMSSPELVLTATERYTSRDMLEAERRMLEAGDALAQGQAHRVAERHVQSAIRRAEEQLARNAVAQGAKAAPTVSLEQQRAIQHLTSTSGSVALLEGHAGTGKSFLLGAARDAWQAQGFTVVGGALAGKAAEGLELSSGIGARTLASWERSWSLERDVLTPKHVLVIDEAGMLGTRQLGRVLETAREAGAKVVLVGDSRQLQAIEAGSPFRVLGERLGTETLSEVRRQRIDWQREATMAFADKRPAEALGAYHAHGNVTAHLTTEQTRAAVVSAWEEGLKVTPLAQQAIYAYRRDDVRALNELAREVRRGRGELGEDYLLKTENGERVFATGDRLYFGKNDRQLGVKNGTLGTLDGVTGSMLTVRVDGDERRLVQVDLGQYAHLDHGYASTVHKSQGATVDRAYVMASKLFDASTAYVSMSRHRDHVELHWARDEFGTRAELDRTLSREQPKELALEHFDERALTLQEVLQDESRFALLSPAAQRTLIQGYERAYEKLKEKQPFLTLREELARHPKMIAAKELEQNADKEYSKAAQALSDYRTQQHQLRWWQTMNAPESVFVDAEARAKDAYWAAKHSREKLERDPQLEQEISERIQKRNVPMAKHQDRIKAWRERVLDVEQQGLREHVVEQVQKKLGHAVRWASEADKGVKFQVVGSTQLEVPLRGGHDTHGVLLQADNGERVLAPVSAYAVREFELGQGVKLEQRLHGLMLTSGRGMGLGR